MEIERIRTFLDATQTLNFSETAQRLHISQSTVSKHIQDLEHELQTDLFERLGSKLRLTQTGEALVPWARQLFLEYTRFQEMAQSLKGEVAGPLLIACTTAAGKYILPMLSVRFRTRFPRVQVKILLCRPVDVEEMLRNETADLAVVSFEAVTPDLECQHFFTDTIVLITPVGHPWCTRQEIQPEEILQEPFLIREATSGTRRVMQSALAAHDIALEDLNIVLELGNAESIVAAVAAGVGVSFVSKASAKFALEAGRVCEVKVAGFDLQRKICMLRSANHTTSRPAELFWGFIHDSDNLDLVTG